MVFSLYDFAAARALKDGAIGVIPTETIYGLATSAFSDTSVETIFAIKQRPAHKPFAVLVADTTDLLRFGFTESDISLTNTYWPGPYTIILPNNDVRWRYLHRDSNGLSFRVPADEEFRTFLRASGPLAVTSANLAGGTPVATTDEAQALFGNSVSVYMDSNPNASKTPSTVISLVEGAAKIIRP